MPQSSFSCSSCGQLHAGIPLSFAADYPDPYANLSAEARELRAVVGSDQCIIEGQQFYIRGCLEIPIIGTDEVFVWGLWARINEPAFDEISDHWETEGRETLIGPYSGRLANALSIYPNTLNLRLEVRILPVGSRPLFILKEPGNLLCTEQSTGLTRQRAEEYACMLLRMAKA